MAPWAKKEVTRHNRWTRSLTPSTSAADSASEVSSDDSVAPPPAPQGIRKQRAATGPSFILQHYHATGCAGGAFSWRAAKMDPEKNLFMCMGPREYRETTSEDIRISKEDKRRGGGPRVGPFQENIPGSGWQALPKYDFTTKNRSSAFNERMHVEWENHVDHILENEGELPTASVVAKAGFRSCAPCCRDMLALARPTGKTFIMVDLAEDDKRGTFHFVTGDKYLPVPKEACNEEEIVALKKIVVDAQANVYASSEAIYDAVMDLGVPIDEAAQSLYLGDSALMPLGCAAHLKGNALLEVLHAEHFARLPAEYGASIMRDATKPQIQRKTIEECRSRAQQILIAAWEPHVSGVNLEEYAKAAVAPLVSEEIGNYELLKRATRARPATRLTAEKLQAIDENSPSTATPSPMPSLAVKKSDDNASLAGVSTNAPDDAISSWSDFEDPEDV